MSKKIALIAILASLLIGYVENTTASLSDQWYLGAGYASSILLPRAEANEVTRRKEDGQGATVVFGRDFDNRSSGQFQLYSLGDVVFSDDSTASYTAADASLLLRFYDSRDNKRNAVFGLSAYGRFGIGYIHRDSAIALRSDNTSPVYFGAGGGLELYFTDMFAMRSEVLFHNSDTVSANLSLVTRFGGRKSRFGGLISPSIPTDSTAPPRSDINSTVSSQSDRGSAAIPVIKPQALPIPTPFERIPSQQSNNSARGMTPPGSNPDLVPTETGLSNNDLPEVALMVDPEELIDSVIKPTSAQSLQTEAAPIPPTLEAAPTLTVPRVSLDADRDGIPDDIDQCRQSNRNYPVNQNGCSALVQMARQIKFVEKSPLPLPRTEPILEKLVANMIQFSAAKIEIIAHTDSSGDPQSNSSLTRQRLRAIGIYLVQRGINQDRFLLRSFADKQPDFDNNSVEGRQANNRIEIVEIP